MKTRIQTTKNILKGLTNLFIPMLILFNSHVRSQNAPDNVFGISIKTSISMGGLGSTTAPQLTYNYKRHSVALGLNIQNKHQNLAGFRTSYRFVLNPGDYNEVFLFCELAYFEKAYLSERTIKYETKINPERASYFQSTKLRASEQYLGFGVNLIKTGPLNIFGSIGGGFYKTYGLTKGIFGYRDLFSTTVVASLGARFSI
jgi:hypothetical protein